MAPPECTARFGLRPIATAAIYDFQNLEISQTVGGGASLSFESCFDSESSSYLQPLWGFRLDSSFSGTPQGIHQESAPRWVWDTKTSAYFGLGNNHWAVYVVGPPIPAPPLSQFVMAGTGEDIDKKILTTPMTAGLGFCVGERDVCLEAVYTALWTLDPPETPAVESLQVLFKASFPTVKRQTPPPVDTDRDGIFDHQDACPDVPGVANPDPKQNGCPERIIPSPPPALPPQPANDEESDVVVTISHGPKIEDDEITVDQMTQFELDSATIRKEFKSVLNEVVALLKEHPEITKLEIQGHTDDQGPGAPGSEENIVYNQKLSDNRANAIRDYLVSHGIDEKRLVAHGYANFISLSQGKDEASRARNRRVQFKILGHL